MGFLEFGGCYGEAPLIADKQPFGFYMIEHYPVTMDAAQRVEVVARYDSFCEARGCGTP